MSGPRVRNYSMCLQYLIIAHRGFGFVEFKSGDDAKAAIDNMHMNELFGNVIRCNLARPMQLESKSIAAPGI